ncbi:hypothetical protein ES703_109760 [subsurface metagenome]
MKKHTLAFLLNLFPVGDVRCTAGEFSRVRKLPVPALNIKLLLLLAHYWTMEILKKLCGQIFFVINTDWIVSLQEGQLPLLWNATREKSLLKRIQRDWILAGVIPGQLIN